MDHCMAKASLESHSLKRSIEDDEKLSARKTRKSSGNETYGDDTSSQARAKKAKNAGRRSRRGTRPDTDESKAEKAPRLPKRQCALMIGFCGSGFNGMQIQPNVRTIEGVLFDALVKAGTVSQDNADDPVKVSLARAARTDAGVHAAGNVISIKMIMDVPGVKDIVARINEELPPEIRLWGYVRVQNSFNARGLCDSRKYTYCFPTYLLIPPKHGSALHSALHPPSESDQAPCPSTPSVQDEIRRHFWGDISGTPDHDLLRKRRWRVTAAHVNALRERAKKFEGTHNFHNFTVGAQYRDRSNQRHMKCIEISDPAVYGETEWISVLFHGQSFMLHQRKMMSALVLSFRTGTPSRIMDGLYGPQSVFIPKMPALGLLLEHPVFDSYNQKVANLSAKLQPGDADHRPPIDFEVYREDMEKFKENFIYENMRTTEDRTGIFDAWIRCIDAYGGNDLLYLNPQGIIPATAVIKQGEKRHKPFRERRQFDATNFRKDGILEAAQMDETEEVDDQRPIDFED